MVVCDKLGGRLNWAQGGCRRDVGVDVELLLRWVFTVAALGLNKTKSDGLNGCLLFCFRA